jgi:hypothetical protein
MEWHAPTVETQTTPRKRGAGEFTWPNEPRTAASRQWPAFFWDPESGFASAPASFRYGAVTSFGEWNVRL